jgi:hypothetical protein
MLDISPRLLPLLEFVYSALENGMTPSPEPTPYRLVGRWPAWEGAKWRSSWAGAGPAL